MPRGPALSAAAGAWRLRALEPAAARPRRAHLPRRVLRALRLRALERELVRRPLHAHLQRPVPAAGGAAVARSGPASLAAIACAYLFDRPRARPLGRAGAPREPLVRGARRRSRCSRTAGSRSRSAPPSRSRALRALQLRAHRVVAGAARSPARSRARWRRCSSRCVVRGRRSARRARARRGLRRDGGRGARAGRAARRSLFPEGGRVPVLVLGLLAAGALLRRARCCATRGIERGARRCAPWSLAYLALGTLAAGCPEPGRRQRDPARLAVRRPGARGGRCSSRPVAPARRRWSLAALAWRSGLAGRHAGPRHRPRASATRRPSAPTTSRSRAGCTRTARERDRIEIPLHLQPLGDRLPGAATSRSRGAGCASSTSTRNELFYDGRLTSDALPALAAARTAIRWVALPDARLDYSAAARGRPGRAQRPVLPAAARRASRTGASTRCAARGRDAARRAAGRERAARRRSARSPSRSRVTQPGRLRRARARDALLAAERGRRLRRPRGRLDARAGRPARAGARRRSASRSRARLASAAQSRRER